MNTFKASVQYGDLKGSVAADRATNIDARQWLVNNGHMTSEYFVIGIKMYVGENHGEHTDPVSVTFLISELNGYESIPAMIEASDDNLPVKELHLEMNIADFLALFKRFEVTLSAGGILEGNTYLATE
jgi:hypothetical protein